jgi:hypothetical protein
MAVKRARCIDCKIRPRWGTRARCSWCFIAQEPIEMQESWAAYRLQRAQRDPDYRYRARVSSGNCPPGKRWCAGCQWFVPVTYSSGSRCVACASRDRHRSWIKREYGIDPDQYEALLVAQGGRCAICNQMPRTLRLAVDHDHKTGAVRGLLCAGQEQGCNWNFRKALGNPEMARRVYEYAVQPPFQRLFSGRSVA